MGSCCKLINIRFFINMNYFLALAFVVCLYLIPRLDIRETIIAAERGGIHQNNAQVAFKQMQKEGQKRKRWKEKETRLNMELFLNLGFWVAVATL